MDLSPIDLPWEKVSQIYQHFVKDECLTYRAMQNQKVPSIIACQYLMVALPFFRECSTI